MWSVQNPQYVKFDYEAETGTAIFKQNPTNAPKQVDRVLSPHLGAGELTVVKSLC